ncbi:MAG: DHHW family protein, partial [Oscillospiraceae bacterium]|nr:DHHW family protein [Oscillospiraceae bacterium]
MDKRPEKLTDQDNLIALQMNMKQKTRLLDILTILFLMLILYGFAAAMIILPDNTFSEQENRYLQQAPKLTLERLIGGKFTSEIGDYYSDQFPIRDIFVGAKAITEIAALKMENNKVILGKDGYIIKRDDYPEMLMVERNLISVTAFSGTMKELNVPYAIAMAGRNVDVLEKYLPALFPYERTLHLWNYFEETMASDGYIQYIDLKSPLKATVESSNEQLYYKADHHWTTLGAYYGYAEIMKAF